MKNINRGLATLLIVIALALVVVIIFLKSHAGSTNGEERTTADTINMAVPDTSLTPDVRVAVAPDSTATYQPDTLTVEPDTRPADEAGAEDGYWDGYHDGVAGKEQEHYDASSSFSRQQQRDTYAANYDESYHRGFAEGSRARE